MSTRHWAGLLLFSAGCVVDHSGTESKRRADPLQIGPCFQTVGVGAAMQVDAIGGVPPYHFRLSTNQTGGTLDDSGQYVAGPKAGIDGLQVIDSNNVKASVPIQVTRTLTVGPQFHSLQPSHTLQLAAGAGQGPFRFTLVKNASAATIDAITGLYTAGGNEGVDTVAVSDASGATSTVDVTVSASDPEGNQSCPASQLSSGIVTEPSSDESDASDFDTGYVGNYDYGDDTSGYTGASSSSDSDGWENSSDPGQTAPPYQSDPSQDAPPSDPPANDDPPPSSSDDSSSTSSSTDDSSSSSDDSSGSSDPDNKRAGKKKHAVAPKR